MLFRSKASDSIQLSMIVVAQGAINASSTEITVDITTLTLDETYKYNPILTNVVPSTTEIGPYKHDNYFMYKFDGIDWDNDSIKYSIDLGSEEGFDASGFDTVGFDPGGLTIPLGLTLDPDTGWLTGYLPYQSELSVTYQFYVRVYKDQVTYIDDDGSTVGYYQTRRPFQLTVLGQTLSPITWLTNENLGSIENGAVSELQLEATSENGNTLYYEFKTGAHNKIPPGLELQSNGMIYGRATFSTFKFEIGRAHV